MTPEDIDRIYRRTQHIGQAKALPRRKPDLVIWALAFSAAAMMAWGIAG